MFILGSSMGEIHEGGDGSDVIFGFGGDDNISGNAGNDVIFGDDGDDTISGGDGHDILFGDAGTDVISGGAGNDIMYGGAGNDRLFGDSGEDIIFGGIENDYINGGDGDDLLSGEDGDDYIEGGAGNDIIFGGDGNDTINGGGQNDIIYGGNGFDTAIFSGNLADNLTNISVNLDEGVAMLNGSWLKGIEYLSFDDNGYLLGMGDMDREDTISAVFSGNLDDYLSKIKDYVESTVDDSILEQIGEFTFDDGDYGIIRNDSEEDSVNGTDEDEIIYGSNEDDLIEGRGGADVIFGGEGYDTAVVSGAFADYQDNISIDTNAEIITVGETTFNGVESLRFDDLEYRFVLGTSDDDSSIIGSEGSDFIYAGNGDDFINGNGGNDIIDGGQGADTVSFSGDFADYLDTVAFNADDGTLNIDGSKLSNVEMLNFNGSQYTINNGSSGYIMGTYGNDIINSSSANDSIFALNGDDVIYGSEGSDMINGGEGSDTVVFSGNYSDYISTISADAGNAVVMNGYLNRTVTQEVEALKFDDYTVRIGSVLDDEISGDEGNDIFYGGMGDDTFYSKGGSDIIYGGDGEDIAVFAGNFDDYKNLISSDGETQIITVGDTELSGIEILRFDDGDYNIIQGTNDSDDLTGTAGNDIIFGYDGNDTIAGGEGRNIIFGGSGDDQILGVEGDNVVVVSGDREDYGYGNNSAIKLNWFAEDGQIKSAHTIDGQDGFDTIIEAIGDNRSTTLRFDDMDLRVPNDATAPITLAVDDTVNGTEDNSIVISVSDLYENDRNGGDTPLTLLEITDVSNGTVELSDTNNDGINDQIIFTPDENYNSSTDNEFDINSALNKGEAGFNYTITDEFGMQGVADRESTGHVTLNIEAVNDAPVIDIDSHYFDPTTLVGDPDHPEWGSRNAAINPEEDHYSGTGGFQVQDVDSDPSQFVITTSALGFDYRDPHYLENRHAEGEFSSTLSDTWSDSESNYATFDYKYVGDYWDEGGNQGVEMRQFTIYVDDGDGNTDSFDNAGCNRTNWWDPIVLDLDGDGVELVSAEQGVSFDLDADGIKENTGWAFGDDGILAYDRDGNGLIENIDELVFTDSDSITDLEALRLYFDTNKDGLFNASDEQWANFGVWQDANMDGITDEGEFVYMQDSQVTEINLSGTEVSYTEEGNLITEEFTYTNTDGQQYEGVNAYFGLRADSLAAQTAGDSLSADQSEAYAETEIAYDVYSDDNPEEQLYAAA